MMKIIGFGIVSINLIYLILYPICETLRGELIEAMLTILKLQMGSLGLTLFISIAELIVGLPHPIVLISLLFNQKTTKLQKYFIVLPNQKFSIVTKDQTNSKLVSICFVIGISLTKSAANYILAYTSMTYKLLIYPSNLLIPYETILTYGMAPFTFIIIISLNYFIFHLPFYKHRLYSLVLMIIGMCFQIFPNIKFERSLEIVFPLYCIAYFLNGIQFVSEKWLMDQKYFTASGLLFYEGLIGFLTNVVLGYFLENVFPSTSSTFGGSTKMWNDFAKCFNTPETVWYAIGIIIVKGIGQLSMMQVRYYYTPMHCGVSNFLSSLGIWFSLLGRSKIILDNIGFIISGHVLLILGILIYTEIIILYVFNFHTYTTKEINKRSLDEFTDDINNSIIIEELQEIQTDETILINNLVNQNLT